MKPKHAPQHQGLQLPIALAAVALALGTLWLIREGPSEASQPYAALLASLTFLTLGGWFFAALLFNWSLKYRPRYRWLSGPKWRPVVNGSAALFFFGLGVIFLVEAIFKLWG